LKDFPGRAGSVDTSGRCHGSWKADRGPWGWNGGIRLAAGGTFEKERRKTMAKTSEIVGTGRRGGTQNTDGGDNRWGKCIRTAKLVRRLY